MAAPALPIWPTFDVAEIAQEASERAGIEFRSGYSLRTARRALELLLIEWANRGLNLWTIEGPVSVDMVPGVNQYTLPEDTVDLIDHVCRSWYGPQPDQFNDLFMDRMTLPEYDAIPNKLTQGRPTVIHIRRQIVPYFLVWLTPSSTPLYQIVYWRLRRMAPLGAGGTGTPEVPWRFIPALIAGLAYYMSLKSTDPNAVQRVQMLKDFYEEQFGLASDEDRDRATIRFIPGGYQFL